MTPGITKKEGGAAGVRRHMVTQTDSGDLINPMDVVFDYFRFALLFVSWKLVEIFFLFGGVYSLY